MSAKFFARFPLRRVLALSAAATVVAGAAFATTTAPSAEAKAGRRFCMYVNGERTQDHKTRYIVVNYKKDGKCPYINPEKHPDLISLRNPVPKLTCERVSGAVDFDSKYYRDLCYLLRVDTVYELFKRDGHQLDIHNDIRNYGHVTKFR